jgi:hypothetical protein
MGVDGVIKEKKGLPDAGTAHLTPFGADVKSKIGMGSKYVFKPDKNPPVGAYNIESAFEKTSPNKKSATIRQPVSSYRRPIDPTPEPYDGHLIPMGKSKMSNITMGSKYIFKPDNNPPVGGYNTDRGINMISSRARSALIRTSVSTYKRPDENLPEPGKYDGHLIPFG